MSTPTDPNIQSSNVFKNDRSWKRLANKSIDRITVASDWAGKHANRLAAKAGVESFWPVTGDWPLELEKCTKILRLFCTQGLPTLEEPDEKSAPSSSTTTGKKEKPRKHRVFRKIPPSVIKNAKGIVIFTAMRTAQPPLGGSGGGGLIVIRKSDGSWTQPSFICPNNLSLGFSFGLDVYNSVLILNTDAAVKGFMSHKVTLGAEMAIAAGPLGYGMSAESGIRKHQRAPIYSYITTKGLYGGVAFIGQVFVHRPDENAIAYNMRDVKPLDIFEGRVTSLPGTAALHQALHEAETGTAQGPILEYTSEQVDSDNVQTREEVGHPSHQDQNAVEGPAMPYQDMHVEKPPM